MKARDFQSGIALNSLGSAAHAATTVRRRMAIGDWWLPVDDIWLVAADVSSHGRATPLLDHLTAKAEQRRRRS
jgi:hypothetical protein